MRPMDVPPGYSTTRRSLHAVAEHVLAAARHRATGRIGLEVAPGGFATPPFEGTVVRVDGTELMIEDSDGARRAPITTLRAAGALVGIEPGMPPAVYAALTPLLLDEVLPVDPAAALVLAGWFERGNEALRRFRDEIAGADVPGITLWPEHLDLAFTAAEVNVGISPGDDGIGEPYAYIGPWARPLPGDAAFWNQPFGAAITHADLASADDIVGFFRAGWVAAR